MLAGTLTSIRWVTVLTLILVVLGCGDSQMTLLDEELNKYRYEQEQFRRESLEDLYFEETMRCENLTAEILDAQRLIEEKTARLREVKARLAELEAQLAEAEKQLAAAEQRKPPATPPEKTPQKPPEQK